MKRLLSLLLSLLLAVSLTACGGGDQPSKEPNGGGNTPDSPGVDASQPPAELPAPEAHSKWIFQYQSCPLPMNAKFAPLLEVLGEPENYFEAASCAFDGLDKTYTYSGMEIITYPDEDVDYISSIRLLDNSVSTPEGITIGSSQEDVVAAYGTEFSESGTQYSYEDGDTLLNILFQDGVAVSVEYIALNDLLG